MIPYGRQHITEDDIEEVVKILKSEYLTQGPVVQKFEDAISNYTSAKHSVAFNSATSALHVACIALDLGPGDWLWTSPNTFVASANCGLYCGANIDFVDIDPNTYNLCATKLEEKLKISAISGKLPKVVIPVHYAGHPCDMRTIYHLSQIYGFHIIEDASHAIGAEFFNSKIGNCLYSDITVFSFHPVKIITTGEGGAASTNDTNLAEKMRRLRTHGITTDKNLMDIMAEEEIWNYRQIELGYNYRMTDIHAALGCSQIKRIDEYINKRTEIAQVYDSALKDTNIVVQKILPSHKSSFHLYPIRIKKESMLAQRSLYEIFHQNGILVNVHYPPVHRQPYYKKLGFKAGDFPEAESFHREVLTLPIYPMLTAQQQQKVIDVLNEHT
ncbi:UDP-4-amino-4,6-dideoxy-N-acetyl-beta-L-altrosamine transaminase [Betaproteobacteria bacterium LSUCC0117]|nr:UDP-4-amino-4,6-dideoxy-N-acetyl-beta-L-altrosamine transaminase [Betaproteobacteria bacterium LSUCC0117]